tara:strand:- start:6161 stop:6463 length:303 start_codon:yes stop_codon:yes gene_type:complete
MKNTYLSILFLILASCTSVEDAGKILRNEKIKTTDEFLVKKKKPLILPPDYDDLPKPGEKISKESSEDDKIKNILKSPEKRTNKNNSSSTEQSILNQIRK